VVPHGDAEDCAHSRRVEDEICVLGGPKQNVVRVLVLDDHVLGRNLRIAAERPTHRFMKTLKRSRLGEQLFGGTGHGVSLARVNCAE